MHARYLREASSFERRRREFSIPTGAQALAGAIKADLQDRYSVKPADESPHVTLRSADVDVPGDGSCIYMLSTLPSYSQESNGVDPVGKSSVLFKKIESIYGFVNGPESEYIACFHRTDLPEQMWTYRLASEVKAFCGFPLFLRTSLHD